jgi:ubiquinol-cytochrome c reductase cytochrome b subunit
LHYLFPFLLSGISFLHIIFLHIEGSKNPINLEVFNSSLSFTPYFVTKDLLGLFFLFIFCVFLVNFHPDLLGHSDNYIKANILVTPLHIVPE